MAKDCSTCFFFVDIPGLYPDDPSGLCSKSSEPQGYVRVNPEDGLNCMHWRPKTTAAATTPQTLAVRNVEQTTPRGSNAYQVEPTPLDLSQHRPSENTVKQNEILRVSFKGEWLVTAIGRTALLAINPQTNLERVFNQKDFDFERLRTP